MIVALLALVSLETESLCCSGLIFLFRSQMSAEENVPTEAHPLFFDSLFPSFQSTTPETVISDYRQRKRADSRAEHDPLEASDGVEVAVEMRKFTENNVEFYAEVIGKLVGSIRDGFTTLIDDVKQRRSEQKNPKEVKIEKLKNHHTNANSTSMSDMIQLYHTSSQANGSTTDSLPDSDNNQNIVSSTMRADESDESGKEDSTSWGSVVQVIARKQKHKRSDPSHRTNANQLEFPISTAPLGEMTNERVAFDFDETDESIQRQQSGKIDSTANASWYSRKKNLFANLTESHRQRKENLIKLIHRFLSPSGNDENADVVSLAIRQGNATVANLTPKQFLRMFHRGSDEHAELQKQAKGVLQSAFYRYARLYLLARKGYKDVRSFNRMAKQQLSNDEPDPVNEFLQNEIPDFDEDYDEDDNDEIVGFVTNSARRNLQTLEAFAILILEIFGAIMGLTIGALGQLQGGAGLEMLP